MKDAREEKRALGEQVSGAVQARDRAVAELATLQAEHAVLKERSTQQAVHAEAERLEHSAHLESLKDELRTLRKQAAILAKCRNCHALRTCHAYHNCHAYPNCHA
mgnify:CR=1 FL=1